MGLASAILAIPALTALLVAAVPASHDRLIKGLALAGAGATFAVSWSLLAIFDNSQQAPQFVERRTWIPEIGISYHIGLDGLSLVMILLTALLSVISVVVSLEAITRGRKAYFISFLALEFAILGVFLARDWFLFYLFWEIALIPMFLLIGIWGDERRGTASMSFFLYTFAGSVCMLIGIVAAYLETPGRSFDMTDVASAASGASVELQIFIFAAFFIGMAVKVPIVPLHGWLPLAHVQAPIPVSIMLSGVLLKMGGYGVFRLLEVAPAGALWFSPWLFVLALASIIYGAFMAWRQDDLKAMVAFSSISHMGFVLLGVASLTVSGLSGAVMQMFSHGLVTAALFILVGIIYLRTHSRRLSELSGTGRKTPRFAVAMTITLLAAMGIPGLSGFVGEFQALIGAYGRWGLWVALAGIGILATSAFCLRVFGQLIGAQASRTHNMADLGIRDAIALAPLVGLMVVLGLYPGMILALVRAGIEASPLTP